MYKNLPPEEVLETCFRQHYAELCRGVYRLLADQALSEDLVQEVFIRVWERRQHISFDERFIFYLKKSCYHAALAHLSSNKKHLHHAEDTLQVAGTGGADEDMLHSELEDSVRLAIAALPEKTRLVFTLSRYEGLTYRQIADQLGVSAKAIEKHMGIALSRLREALKDHLLCLVAFLFY